MGHLREVLAAQQRRTAGTVSYTHLLTCYIPVSAIAKINLAIIIQIFNIVTVATKFIFFKRCLLYTSRCV